MSTEAATAAPAPASRWLDIIAIAVCTLAWGTTWFAITLQLGAVDPVISVVYRFALASVLLFAWCAITRAPVGMTRAQHLAALGIGFFTFAVDYPLVYWAEERVVSAVVAVTFAAMAFVNLISFRIFFGQRAPALAWGAAALGILGVGILSWTFVPTLTYMLSLLHLALIGSVVAFLTYFALARRRGYATASYISALTPPLALLMSALFEHRTWGLAALLGVALTLSGQVLLLRAKERA
ncbi:MAG: EamA family transporter [Terricaulis sp.]